MKREILRIENINSTSLINKVRLSRFTLHISEGELCCLIIPNRSYRQLFISLFNGELKFSGLSLFCEEKVESFGPLNADGSVILIPQEPVIFKNLSIADNLMLIRSPGGVLKDRSAELHRIYSTLESLDLSFNPSRKASSLNLFEQHMLNLAMHYSDKTKLVMFIDSFNTYTEEEMQLFTAKLRYLKSIGIAALCISFKPFIFMSAADMVSVTKGNHKRLNLYRDNYSSALNFINAVETLYTGKSGAPGSEQRTEYSAAGSEKDKNTQNELCDEEALTDRSGSRTKAMIVRDVNAGGISADFKVSPGEIAAVRTWDYKTAYNLSSVLSGRYEAPSGAIYISHGGRLSDRLRDIYSGTFLLSFETIKNHVFTSMDVLQNAEYGLMLTGKMKLQTDSGIRRSLLLELEEETDFSEDALLKPVSSRDYDALWQLVYYRIRLLDPSVLIICAPSLFLNAELMSLFTEFLSRFTKRGGAAVIVSPLEEDLKPAGKAVYGITA